MTSENINEITEAANTLSVDIGKLQYDLKDRAEQKKNRGKRANSNGTNQQETLDLIENCLSVYEEDKNVNVNETYVETKHQEYAFNEKENTAATVRLSLIHI